MDKDTAEGDKISDLEDYSDEGSESISLERKIECPHCGELESIDLSDYCFTETEERKMGEERRYFIDYDKHTCIRCKKAYKIKGYISEYPLGALGSEEINTILLQEDDD